jgi:hypothetical protein
MGIVEAALGGVARRGLQSFVDPRERSLGRRVLLLGLRRLRRRGEQQEGDEGWRAHE